MSFFKAYDMRGTFGVDFNLAMVRSIGRHLPAVVRKYNAAAHCDTPPGRRFRALIGRDGRKTSPAIATELAAGLAEAGAEVVDMGLVTTPMVYFFTAEEDFDCSVMITASHNPPSDNGLKVSRRGALPMGYESGLAELERLVKLAPLPDVVTPQEVQGVPTDAERLAKYVGWLKAHGAFDAEASGLNFAVDCSDGAASVLAHELFGERAVYLNDVIDGEFSHHSPNPLQASAREQLVKVVRERQLDCGVIFDGDADRCMFVDERGEFVQPDYLIPVLADTFAERGAVIHDVRTSRAAIEHLAAEGFRPVIGKVGHAYAKVLLRETKAICGGELAGHYYFRDFHFCDSGCLAALRILGAFAEAKREGRQVSAMLAPINRKYANSGEMNFKVEDKPAAIRRILAVAATLGVETGRSELDGYRLEFAEGWISIRQSNTEPYLRLIVECTTEQGLEKWRQALTSVI